MDDMDNRDAASQSPAGEDFAFTRGRGTCC